METIRTDDDIIFYLNPCILLFNYSFISAFINNLNPTWSQQEHKLSFKKALLNSQWSLSSKPPTTSPRQFKVPFLVPATKQTRRLPRTAMPALVLGKLAGSLATNMP